MVAVSLFSTVSTAQNNSRHKINNYKYLCMEQQGNLYDLEDRFNNFFESIGFTILTPDEEENLSDAERLYVLYGSYIHNAVQDALNNTTLTLRDKDGKIIFSSTKESACFVSVKRCAEKGADKIIQQIRALNYSFEPALGQNGEKMKIVEREEPTGQMKQSPSANKVKHKINGYKYFCMEQQGNLYDLEDRFNNFFASIGFTILTPDDEEDFDESEKMYVLYGTYFHNAVQDALNNTTLTLRNKDGKIIFSSTKESACFVSVKRCAEKGADKIIKQIRDLNYSFDSTIIQNNNEKKTTNNTETSNEIVEPSGE